MQVNGKRHAAAFALTFLVLVVGAAGLSFYIHDRLAPVAQVHDWTRTTLTPVDADSAMTVATLAVVALILLTAPVAGEVAELIQVAVRRRRARTARSLAYPVPLSGVQLCSLEAERAGR